MVPAPSSALSPPKRTFNLRREGAAKHSAKPTSASRPGTGAVSPAYALEHNGELRLGGGVRTIRRLCIRRMRSRQRAASIRSSVFPMSARYHPRRLQQVRLEGGLQSRRPDNRTRSRLPDAELACAPCRAGMRQDRPGLGPLRRALRRAYRNESMVVRGGREAASVPNLKSL
jgi:hypothetical protein